MDSNANMTDESSAVLLCPPSTVTCATTGNDSSVSRSNDTGMSTFAPVEDSSAVVAIASEGPESKFPVR